MTGGGYLWVSLAGAFVLELCGLAAFGYWGARTGTHTVTSVALGVGVPLVAAVLWGVFAAPRAPVASAAAAGVVQVVFFLAAALALASTGHPRLGATFLILVMVKSVLLHLQPTSTLGAGAAGEHQAVGTFHVAHNCQAPGRTVRAVRAVPATPSGERSPA